MTHHSRILTAPSARGRTPFHSSCPVRTLCAMLKSASCHVGVRGKIGSGRCHMCGSWSLGGKKRASALGKNADRPRSPLWLTSASMRQSPQPGFSNAMVRNTSTALTSSSFAKKSFGRHCEMEKMQRFGAPLCRTFFDDGMCPSNEVK